MFSFILDLIFPKRCVSCGKIGQYFCKECLSKIKFVENQVCPQCRRPSISSATHFRCQTKLSLDGLISAVYYMGPARTAIHKLKYKFIFDLAAELTKIILSNQSMSTILHNIVKNDFVLVPIPLHFKREEARGFNQAEKIAAILAKKLSLEMVNDILVRVKDTRPQTGLPAKERRKNVIGAFKVVNKREVADKNFILVDDLVTTGSTLKSAGLVLKRAGASKVWGLTFARTAPSKLS